MGKAPRNGMAERWKGEIGLSLRKIYRAECRDLRTLNTWEFLRPEMPFLARSYLSFQISKTLSIGTCASNNHPFFWFAELRWFHPTMSSLFYRRDSEIFGLPTGPILRISQVLSARLDLLVSSRITFTGIMPHSIGCLCSPESPDERAMAPTINFYKATPLM